MGHSEFEHILSEHCAPVLMGCKIANLVSVKRESEELFTPFLEEYRRLFTPKNIRIRILCRCGERIHLLFYRPESLFQVLCTEKAQSILIRCGYPAGASLDRYLDILSVRMSMKGEFPHEIGLFLGYPAEDVTGFQENKGKNYIFSRYWKVYSNPEETGRLFERFDLCRDYMRSRLNAGFTLSQILETAVCA